MPFGDLTGHALSLFMDDVGLQHLHAGSGSGALPLTEFWPVALQLARVVAQLHTKGDVHGAISPVNVRRDTKSATLGLIDPGTNPPLFSTEGNALALHDSGAAYLAPEQSGRTGQSVDWRSDLYSLGATFYALLTGAPPFVTQDPMELIHAHLARQPRPPHAIDPVIPPVLSGIVLKLLKKEPHERYPSAGALLADLREASAQWFAHGVVHSFPLGERDVLRPLSMSEKLYGRQAEATLLRGAFTRACDGRRELALVGGAPGSGKSALVRDLEQEVIGHSGLFAAGKFDQLERNIPYAGLLQALRALIQQLLTESETALASWRERIRAAIAPNGAILVGLLPELQVLSVRRRRRPRLVRSSRRTGSFRYSSIFWMFWLALAIPSCCSSTICSGRMRHPCRSSSNGRTRAPLAIC